MSENPPNPLDSLLTEFALGPSWARAKSEPTAKHTHESPEREHPQRRRDDRDDRGENRGRREGGDRREGADRRGQRDDRGDNRGRREGGGDRRDFQKGRGRAPEIIRREEFIAPAEGVNVTIIPDKSAIQLVCKEIHQVARVYPLFDIAEIILAERVRCRAIFEISEKHEPFYRCKLEDAIFLTKEEAMRHLLESPWKNRFIGETTVETDPPKGNFQSVARCGISGKLLGPPNYHGYQPEIRRVHREFFPEMPFDSYIAKIRTDRSEDAVGAWMDSMKTQTRWRILSDEESAAVVAEMAKQAEEPKPEPTPAAEETVAAADSIRPTEPEPEPSPEAEDVIPPSEEPVSEEEIPATEDPAAETSEPEPAAEEVPAAAEIKWFTDRAEFERSLAAEILGKAYHITRKIKVSAAIPARNLSPGLFARLKATGSHHRKHPAIMIPEICKILESEHMPVFKRKGKLFTGPARPSALALDAILADRPGQMVKWIRENPPAKLEGLWQAMLPEGSTAPPQGYAADLFWLLQQGHILLYTDDTLVVQDPPPPQGVKKPKQPKKKAVPAEAVAATERSEMAGQDNSPTSPANCIRPAEPNPTPEEPSVSEEPFPEPTEPTNETSEAISESEETPSPICTEPASEPVEENTEVLAEVTEPVETPAAIQEAAPEPTEESNEILEPSSDPSESAPEEDPAKAPLP